MSLRKRWNTVKDEWKAAKQHPDELDAQAERRRARQQKPKKSTSDSLPPVITDVTVHHPHCGNGPHCH